MTRCQAIQVVIVLAVGLGIGWVVGASRMQAGLTAAAEPAHSARHAGGSELCSPGSPMQDCCQPGLNRAALMK